MPLQLGRQVLSFQAAGEESKGVWIIPWVVLIFDMAESDMKHTFPTHVQHRHLMQREGTPWEAVCLLRGRGHWCQIISSLAHSKGYIFKVQKNGLAKSSCSVYPFLCLYVYVCMCGHICLCMCMCRPENNCRCHFPGLKTSWYLRQGFSHCLGLTRYARLGDQWAPGIQPISFYLLNAEIPCPHH